MKLRFQLGLLVLAAIVASLGATMTITLLLTRNQMEADASSAAEEAAGEITHDLEQLPPLTDEGIQPYLEKELRDHRRLTEIELELQREETVSRYSVKTHAGSLIRHEEANSSRKTGPRTIAATVGQSGARTFEVSDPLNGRIGHGRVKVTLSLETVDRILGIQAKVTYLVAAVAVLLAAFVAAFVADRVLGAPLQRLASAMGEVSQGALGRRVDAGGPPEIRAVSEAFNRMLDRLQEADAAVRSFNSRLADEVRTATVALSDRNAALGQLNTLLVRAREDLAHKERLAVLGQLAAQLAHEVGTPLGSVSGHLQLALATPDCPPAMRDRLLIATQEITRVSRIIRDYLDSTRRIEPEIHEVDIDRTIREAVEVARGGNPARSAAVYIEVAPVVSRWRTDEGVVRQILVNLIANALDAVSTIKEGEPGHVTVRAQTTDAPRAPGRGGVELTLRVSDTGPGIAPEAFSRMFEPFYTTKGRGKGTGLGLAICRELANSLGGKIEGTSEPGRGTTFTVRVPNGDEIARRTQATAGVKQAAPLLN